MVSVPENAAGLCCPAMLFYQIICIAFSRDVSLYVRDIKRKLNVLVVGRSCGLELLIRLDSCFAVLDLGKNDGELRSSAES
jgi:hypothetical protein